MEGKHEDQPRGGFLFLSLIYILVSRFSLSFSHLTLKVGLFKKWKQEQGRSKKQLRLKQEDYEDEEEEEEDERNEEDGDEDEEDEDKGEEEDIEKKSNKKISNAREEDDDESDGYDDPEEEEEDGEDEEYPEGVTEYDPPDSLHSCTDITMTDRLLDRLNITSIAR